jgi:hypothetical protein
MLVIVWYEVELDKWKNHVMWARLVKMILLRQVVPLFSYSNFEGLQFDQFFLKNMHIGYHRIKLQVVFWQFLATQKMLLKISVNKFSNLDC